MIINNPSIHYSWSIENICIPMTTRYDRLIFVFRDMEGKMIRLNGEFELQFTFEDRIEGEGEGERVPTL